MTARRPLLLVLVVLPLFLGMSAEEGVHGSATMDFLAKLVNALVLFGGLTFVLRKPIKAMLIRRTADADLSLRQAATGRTEAEAKAESTKVKLAGLAVEVDKLKTEAAEDTKRETERIARAAADEADRLKTFTRQELDEQLRRGVGELKSYAAARATAAARERIRRRLSPKIQSALIDKSIDRLSKLHEEPGPR
jgi:F0F1-type ATP synthase membrane subunit b/b'